MEIVTNDANNVQLSMDQHLRDKVNRMLRKYGLDFIIEKRVLFGFNQDDVTFKMVKNSDDPDAKDRKRLRKVAITPNEGAKAFPSPYYGLYNSKTGDALNTCKEGYVVSQNAEVVELVLRGMEKFGDTLRVTKAGALHGGRKVFFQLGIKGFNKIGDEEIERFVTIIDSNDGSTGLSVGIGDKVMSCENQFFKFYKKGEAKFRHTSTLEVKLKTMPVLIETALSESMKQMLVYQKFMNTPLTKNLADAMVKEVLGHDRIFTSLEDQAKKTSKAINHMDSLYASIDDQIADKGENLFGLFSGVTHWTTHTRAKPKRVNGFEETLMVGSAYTANMAAYNFAVNEAGILIRKNELVLS
jgi:hypothetical protein